MKQLINWIRNKWADLFAPKVSITFQDHNFKKGDVIQFSNHTRPVDFLYVQVTKVKNKNTVICRKTIKPVTLTVQSGRHGVKSKFV